MRRKTLLIAVLCLAVFGMATAQQKKAPTKQGKSASATKKASPAPAPEPVVQGPIREVEATLRDSVDIQSRSARSRTAPDGERWLQLRFTMTNLEKPLSLMPEDITLTDGKTEWHPAGFYHAAAWYAFDDLAQEIKMHPPMMKAGDWWVAMTTFGSGQMDFSAMVKDTSVRLDFGANCTEKSGWMFLVPKSVDKLKLKVNSLPSVPIKAEVAAGQ
jgi:hypothetical protein